MGDTLLLTPLIRALRARHPDARITVVTKAAYGDLFRHNPRVTDVLELPPGGALAPLAQELRGRAYTHRFDLHGSLRSRALRLLVGGRWTGYPKHRLARWLLIRTKRNRYRDRRPVAERMFDAAKGLDVVPDAGSLELFIPRPARDAADQFLAGAGLAARRQLIALAPGASAFTKRWPQHHWVALARRLVELENDVVVVGGDAEAAAATEIAAAAGTGAASAAGRFDLPGTAALLKRSRALVSGDTGAMHLATAVGAPVLALFGPTVEPFGFFPYHAKAIVLQRDLGCRPCSKSGGPACPLKHHRCLQDLQPEEVLEALRRLPR
jgi:heptosyltransferase-2